MAVSAAAPGARVATGRDLRLLKPHGPKDTDKPGQDSRVTEKTSIKESSGVVGSIKKWLADRAKAKEEAREKVAEQERKAAELAAEEERRRTAAKAQQQARIDSELKTLKQKVQQEELRKKAQEDAKSRQPEKPAQPTKPGKRGQPPKPQAKAQPPNYMKAPKEIELTDADFEEVKEEAKPKKATPPPIPSAKAQARQATNTGKKSEPESKYPKEAEKPKSLLRGKKGGQYYLSRARKKIYV